MSTADGFVPVDFTPVYLDEPRAPQSSTKVPEGFAPVNFEPRYLDAPAAGRITLDRLASAIEMRESGGDAEAVSPQGARGSMQIMPGTFDQYKRPGERFENDSDRRAAARRKLEDDWLFYGGDPHKVAAAYIGGRGAVLSDGTVRDDVADAHGTTPKAYADQVTQRLGAANSGDRSRASDIDARLASMDLSRFDAIFESFGKPAASTKKEKEPAVMASAGRGAAAGLTSMASAIGSGVQFIGERLGAKGMADYGKRVADAWDEVGEKFAPQGSIQGSILDDPKLLTKGAWWAYNIANVVPSFAASVVPGVAAGRGLQVLGQTMKWAPEVVSRLAWLGGSIVGGAAGGSLEGAQTYQEVQKRGGSESEAAAAGTQMALASAALNAISLGNLTAKAKNVVTKFLKTGVWEGLTEWAEEPTEGAILSRTSVARPEDDPMLRAREGFNVFPVAAVTGGIGGAMSGTRAPKPEARPGPQGDQQILDAVAQSEQGKTPENVEAAAAPRQPDGPTQSPVQPEAGVIPPTDLAQAIAGQPEEMPAAAAAPGQNGAMQQFAEGFREIPETAQYVREGVSYAPTTTPTEAERAADHLAATERQFRDNQIAQDVSQSALPYERVTPTAANAPAPATEPAAQPAAFPDRLELVPIEQSASGSDQQYDFSRIKSFNSPQSAALAAARALQETGQRHDIVAHPTQPDALAVVPSGSGMAAAVARVAAPSVARQDAARMGSIEDLAVDGNGSLALPENEPMMRAFLQSLPVAEAAAMVDAQGRVTQIGMRRFQNAVLARAYGGNPVVQKLLSGKTAFAQRLSASLTKMAPMVSAIKDAVQQRAVADRDITDTIVGAVDELVRMKAEGRKPGQALAQSGLFQDVTPETAALIEFIEENLNAPDRLNAFLQAYLEELQRYGSDQQGQLFSGPATPQGADLIDAARSRMDGRPQFQQPPAKELGNVEGGEVSQVEGAPGEGGLQERAGEAAANADATAASVGTADAAEVPGAPEVGQQRGDRPVDGADAGRGAGEGKSDAVAEQDAPAAASDQVEKAEVPTETQEQDAAAKIAEASRDAAHSPENDKPLPSRAQIEAGNYSLGHVRLFGLDISIENPKGSTRTGIDPDGQPWQVKMVAAYGYLKKTTARDGDHVDVYLTGNPTEQTPVFVVDQIDPKTGRFDEHKIIFGADTQAEAEAIYDAHFSDKSGPQRRGAIRQWTLERFKTWLKTGNTKRPVTYKEPKAQKPETASPKTDMVKAKPETQAAPSETPARIDDVGEKIGGARKDLWRDRGLSVDDLSGMTGGEQSQFATKDNVWPKIDYAKRIADGMEPKAAALLKQIRDGIAAKPRKDDVDGRRRYVETLGMLRDMAADARTVDDVKGLSNKLTSALGVQAGATSLEGRAALERLWSIYKGRTNPIRIGWEDERRADRLLKEGWPTPVRGARESKGKDAGETPDRPYLDELQRTGEDLRGGRNVTGEEVKDAFGFRGIEYGNYAAQDERQRLLNLAFDGLHDLASLLGVPPKAVSFNGTLGIAFGARGGGNFAAHYEPGKLVINMTKLRGGGSLAHEWAHALDHYFGELDRPDAYQGKARGATGWYTRGYAKHENLRPEMAAAFDRVMAAIYYKPGTRSQSSYVTQAGKLSGKSGSSGYWARPTELFARAFESYVFDKIASDDRVSQYLVQGVEADRFESDRYKGNPYPTGDERKAINDAFDALVSTLQTRETDRGVAMYSRNAAATDSATTEGNASARVLAELEDRLGRTPDDNVVSIIPSWRDLPEDRSSFIESSRAFDVQGMFDPDTGRVYLIADNLPPGAAFSVFLHELGVHKGMRDFIGAESFTGLVKQIRTWAELSMGEEGKIARSALASIPADTEASVRDEEAVAYFVEEAVRRGHDIPQSRPEKRGLGQWLYDLWQAVRGALAKLRAEPTTLTAADVVALARGAAENAMGQGDAQYTGGIAEPALSVAPGQPATWDAPESSRLDDILYTLQDKHIDTRRVMQAITKHNGGAVADTIDPYLQEELFHGRAAKHVDDFLRTELKPLLADMTQRGVTMQEFESYLHARHAEERNAQIAKVNPNMPDGGSGMTTKDARAHLAAIDPAKRRSFDALAKRVDAITAGTRSTLVANGLESPNAIKAWESAYKHYVPLYREDMEGAPGVGQGFSVKGPASKRAMGSSAAVTDVIANIAMQRERAIVRAEKNRVANALVGLAQANPNPDFWQVDRPPMIRYIDERTGLVTERVDPMFKSRDNVVTARLPDANGEIIERSVSFNETDERAMRMARALKNLDTDDLGLFLSASAKITRYLASINTQYNPVFGVVNITRDVQGALANLSSTPLAGKQSAVLGNTLSALRGIYRDLRDIRSGKQPSSQWAALFEEFQSEGGQTGYRDMFRTSKDRAEAIEKELRKVTEGKAKALGRAVFDWLSDYNNSMENAVRLAAYKVGVDAGMSKQRAASLAKNLTVNFNRKGQAATQVGALYAFFNASTQGTARLVETLRGPMGKRIIMGGLLAGVMQALLIAASDLGDDDDTLKDFVKERNLVIPIGDKQYLTIPMPLGLHVLPNIGRIGAEFALSGFKKPGDRLVSLMGILAEAFNPIGSAGVSVQTIAPTAVDPFVALAENKDWGGRQIARKDFSSLNPTPGHTRAKDSSSWISRELSRALNWATGGTEYTPGLFSPTPDQIDYLVGQVFGGVGREFMKTWETAETSITGEDLPSYKVPLLGRFYGNADEPASHAGRFYDALKEIHIHAAEIKGRRRDGEDVAGYIEEHPEARLIEAAKAAERRVSRLRKQRRELDQDDAGNEALRAIDDRINAEIRRFNDRVRAVSRQESEAAAR